MHLDFCRDAPGRRGCFVGRCAARPAVRGGAPSLSSVAELVGGCVTTGEGRDSSPRASRRACPTSAGTRCDGRRRLPLQPLLQRTSLPGAWARSDSAACRPQPRAHWARSAAFPQLLRKHESTDLADVLGFNFTDVAPAEGLPGAHHAVRAQYSDFAICSWGGIKQIAKSEYRARTA